MIVSIVKFSEPFITQVLLVPGNIEMVLCFLNFTHRTAHRFDVDVRVATPPTPRRPEPALSSMTGGLGPQLMHLKLGKLQTLSMHFQV